MPNPVQALLLLLASATEKELARQVQYLKNENRILRDKLPKRITITSRERGRLLRFGKPLGPTINQLITIVVPETFARWVREGKRKRPVTGQRGRPKKRLALRNLILKIGRETGWGYTRVLGEVRKLTSQKISRQSVANIMREAGLDPGPKRGEKTWDEFIKIHGATLWQTDFLSKRCWTRKGLRDLYLLVFLHVGTRRVFVAPSTAHPNQQWVIEQTKAFLEHSRKEELPAKIVFHDADAKFGAAFDNLLAEQGVQARRLQPRSPNLNAFVERWIQSIQVECLDHFIVFGEAHLNHLVAEYVAHFETERPHQGLANKLVVAANLPEEDIPLLGQVVCRERLGGLLKHYERRAAWRRRARRARRKAGRSHRYCPTSCSMSWIRNWSGVGIASFATPTTATSMSAVGGVASGCWHRSSGS